MRGIIIHAVLRGRDAATVLHRYGEYSDEYLRQCEEIIPRFFGSALMKHVKRSFSEIPFVVTIDGKRVTGKIDRLYEIEDGSWIVIDYKSEASSDYAALADQYAVSMGMYCEAARQIVRAEVRGWIYFTETGVLLEC